MIQSCLNNYLEINLLLVTFFWIYNAKLFPGSEEKGDCLGGWAVMLEGGPRARRDSSGTP